MSDSVENDNTVHHLPFKVFIPALKKWAYIMGMDYITELVTVDLVDCPSITHFVQYHYKDVIFVQSTGLSDDTEEKNAIFEGDVLALRDQDGKQYYSEVTRQGTCLCIDVHGCDYEITAIEFAFGNDVQDVRRIGSKFDQPDLLARCNSGAPSE